MKFSNGDTVRITATGQVGFIGGYDVTNQTVEVIGMNGEDFGMHAESDLELIEHSTDDN